MTISRFGWLGLVAALVCACGPKTLLLTGVVTTNEVIVSPQVTGQLGLLSVVEGDTVSPGQVIGLIVPDELRADSAYYAESMAGFSAQVSQAAAVARWQEQQTGDLIRQAEANAASAGSAEAAAVADEELATLTFKRVEALAKQGLETPQQLDQARAGLTAAQARRAAAAKQSEAARAAVAMAKADLEQNAVRRSQLANSRSALAAASAQRQKAGVRLGYTALKAPIAGIVDVRAARQGEVVTAGQPVVTLINPNDLWVRADVEESYIDRVRLGDSLVVRLPSGVEQKGVVIYRGLDASYATRRDANRTKRDIKTFEIRIRLDNKDRRLAVGMTAYVELPVGA
jgi:multidrug resistance efflux pump